MSENKKIKQNEDLDLLINEFSKDLFKNEQVILDTMNKMGYELIKRRKFFVFLYLFLFVISIVETFYFRNSFFGYALLFVAIVTFLMSVLLLIDIFNISKDIKLMNNNYDKYVEEKAINLKDSSFKNKDEFILKESENSIILKMKIGNKFKKVQAYKNSFVYLETERDNLQFVISLMDIYNGRIKSKPKYINFASFVYLTKN